MRKSLGVSTDSPLEVIVDHVEGLAFLAEVVDNSTAAPHDLPGEAFLVDLAEAGPLAQLLRIVDLDQVDVVFLTERLYQLRDVLLVSALGQHAEECLSLTHVL